jgi:hypothetical protein
MANVDSVAYSSVLIIGVYAKKIILQILNMFVLKLWE